MALFDIMFNYLLVLIMFQPIEEIYNCNNPNLKGTQGLHLLCDWEPDDFYKNTKDQLVLRPKRKKDNAVKAYYRKKYWKRLNLTNK
jgi:hypothetical protein